MNQDKAISDQPDTVLTTREVVSPRRKLLLAIAVIILVIGGLTLLASFGMGALNGVRAYVQGEGLWAKNQKDATHHLLLFAETGDEAEWREYQYHLDVLLGIKAARLELEKAKPDHDVIFQGFIDADIHPSDVGVMTSLFRRFRRVEHLDRAISKWAEADQLMEQFVVLADELHEVALAGSIDGPEGRAITAEILALNDSLHVLEDEFSATLGVAARLAKDALMVAMAVGAVGAVGICLLLAMMGIRLISKAENYAEDLEHRNRLKSAQAGLAEAMSGHEDVAHLCTGVIHFLAKHLGVEVAVFHTADGEGRLQPIANFAYPRPRPDGGGFLPGEGMVGQAALERRPITTDHLPDGYLDVRSGIGAAPPRSLLVYPLLRDGEVMGVLEFGSLGPVGDVELEFLDLAQEAISLALHDVQSRQHIEELLLQTQELNEELQTQQEELRQANDELADHTRALEESQARLEVQQQRLEETNTELEERTEALDRERRQVAEKNAELEMAGRVVEEKARELELTSRYKSDFLANMSHELRTPLNSIIILSGLLSENKDGALTDKQVDFARTINDSGTELIELINEILDLSKIEAGKLQLVIDDVDVRGFLAGLKRQFLPVAESRKLTFEVGPGEGVPSLISSDSLRLGQVAKNLLSNAFKFTKEGSVRLTIDRPRPSELERCSLSTPHSELIALSVEDTGIGIPEEKQNLIFQAFQQADSSIDRKFGGTGLGLAICRELARLLGGEIQMESTEGSGSRFTVILPERAPSVPSGTEVEAAPKDETAPTAETEAEAEVAVPAVAAIERPPTATSTVSEIVVPDDRDVIGPDDRSILIIEDDPTFARTLMEPARDRGFKCIVAASGESGVELAKEYLPTAILLDLGLPGMDGIAVMSLLKDDLTTRHIPVHVISGFDRKLEALKAGAIGFVKKPISIAGLDRAFGNIEDLVSRPVKDLLVVVGDETTRGSIVDLIDERDVEIVAASSGRESLDWLRERSFDCVVLGFDLPDMTGVEVLQRIRRSDDYSATPVVALIDGDLTTEHQLTLDRYADRVVAKGERSTERLLDETALFLHRIEKNLPEDKRKLIRMLHDKEAILNGKVALIVDDDMRNVFALSSVLEEKGMTTRVATNGREALDSLQESPDADLVLMDIMMPEMDGYQAMREIRKQKRFKDLPVIALTAKAMKDDRAKCIEAGASDYLTKPVDTGRLLSILRIWLYR